MRGRTLIIRTTVLAAAVAVSACSSGGSAATPQPKPSSTWNVNLSTPLRQPLCIDILRIFRTPSGQDYALSQLSYTPNITVGGKCSYTRIARNAQGGLTYHAGSLPVFVTPLQPLQLDASPSGIADLFLTQNLSKELHSGGTRFVDSATVETDSVGWHVLAGFPTAAERFYDYYASITTTRGMPIVCLPAGNADSHGLHGSGNSHASTFIRAHVLHDGQGCRLPAVSKPQSPVSISNIPLYRSGFSECANVARDPQGNYFDFAGAYNLQVGLPGYTRWALHVKVTHVTLNLYTVVIIDEDSCLPFEPNIIPIRKV